MVWEDPAKSVRKPPGSMIVTLMPSGPTSLASTSEKPSTPHLAAAYAPRPIGPTRPPTDENWRIRPAPWRRITGMALHRNGKRCSTTLKRCAWPDRAISPDRKRDLPHDPAFRQAPVL